METLEQKIQSFNRRYTVNFDPFAIAEAARIKAVFDDYKFDKKDERTTRAATYWNALTETLDESLNANTKIQAGGLYDLSDFNIVKFVREFEEIMSEANAKSSAPKKRAPFEGMRFESIMTKLNDATKGYDKPLYSIWANKVIDAEISYKNLQSVTDMATQRIKNEEQSRYGSVDRNDLANVVYAHEAMFRVCQSRGFWWKAFHLYQNYKEQKYLESLSKSVSEYTEKNYPIQEITDAIPDSMMQEAYKNGKSLLNWEENQRLNEKIQKQLQAEKERALEISSVAEQLQPIVDRDSFKNELTESIAQNLPKCMWGKNTQKNILNSVITGRLIEEAKNANQIFDEGIRGGENPQAIMVSCVKLVFGKAYSVVSSLGYNDPKDQLLAAQCMTDAVMKKASPAALDSDKYTDLTNGYVLNHPQEFAEVTGMDGTEPAFVNAKNDFVMMNREKLHMREFDSPKTEIAPPVNTQPSKKDLSINK